MAQLKLQGLGSTVGIILAALVITIYLPIFLSVVPLQTVPTPIRRMVVAHGHQDLHV